MKKKLLNEALAKAQEMLVRHPMYETHSKFLHWSFIVKDGKIIEHGTNHCGIPPIHFGYSKRYKGWDTDFYERYHSELDAFRRARGLLRGASFDLINIRLSNKGELRNSCPCEVCQSWLFELGCRHVAFTTDTGWAKMI